jgi:large subunit ribosomal protein L13
MDTVFQTKEEAIANRKWLLVDAENQVVGRVASKVAGLLRGKHKPSYTPHNDGGDFVIIINAEKARFTGNKESDKLFIHHTGFIGGLKEQTAAELREKHPERILEIAVKGMLPKSALGRNMLDKLKVYAGSEHPHAAQQPKQV